MKKFTLLFSLFLAVWGTTASAQTWVLDRTGWTASSDSETNSEGGGNGPASKILDGDPTTYYHSSYASAADKVLPHYIQIDLGESKTFRGFAYTPRIQSNATAWANGAANQYKFYVSDTPFVTDGTWTEPSSATLEGTFNWSGYTGPAQRFVFGETDMTGRYILFAVHTSREGTTDGRTQFANCGEFNLLTSAAAGKTEADLRAAFDLYATANKNYQYWTNCNAKLPGYPYSESEVNELGTALMNAYAAANTFTNVETATSTLTSGLSAVQALTVGDPTFPTDVYFTITNVNGRGSVIYDPTKASEVDSQNGNAEYLQESTSPDLNNKNHLWCFLKNGENYYLYNVGKKLFANATGHGSYGQTWIFSQNPSPITLTNKTAPGLWIQGSGATMSISTAYTGPIITYYTADDGGVPFKFDASSVEVDAEVTATVTDLLKWGPLNEAILNAEAYYDSYNRVWRIADGVNNYHQQEGDADFHTTYNSAKAMQTAGTATAEEVSAMAASLQGLVNNLVINQPEDGKFYRLRCADSQMKRLLASMNMKGGAEGLVAAGIFYYKDSKLLSYTTGQYLGNKALTAVGGTANTVGFRTAANGKVGCYNMYVTLPSETRYLYGASSTLDSGSSTDSRDGYNWWLEPVNVLPVTVSEAGYATLYTPVPLTVNTSVNVYTGTVNGSKLKLTAVEGTIPSNTGVILEATAGDYDFSLAAADVETAKGDLTGSVETVLTTSVSNPLTLQLVDSTIGMYTYTGANLSGFKSYLLNGSGVEGFAFDFGSATGIESLNAATAGTTAVFDLSGRRVTKAQKGLYIVNGKKMFIK